jgi:uroporphyrinogen decarboxylase
MTPRERIKKAIAHEETDYCPYALGIGGALRDRLVKHTGDDRFDRAVVPHFAGVGSNYPNTGERVDATHYKDAYGVVWEESLRGELGVVNDPVLKTPSFEGYTFPSANVPEAFDSIPAQLSAHPDRYSIWGIGFSLYERAWSLRGIEGFLMDMVEAPEFVDELLDRICEFNLEMIDQACEHDFDCVRFGDDWGAQSGMIMGPHLWRRFIKPRFGRMIERALSYGKHTFLHSDGDILEVIPDLIEIGLTILNPVQPDVMDIYEVKRRFGKDLTFWGGVSVQHLLPYCPEEEVRAEIRRLLKVVGAGGGLVIAPTHSLGRDIPLDNLIAMVEEFTDQEDHRQQERHR